jgi:ABC-type branched-subunit amino acid transport system substrate-binding protein
MGIVYLAMAQGPGGFSKLKVIKRLRPDLAGEPGAVQMFLEEGRLSARLLHENVVQMNEVGFDGKHYFLEMEYLEGQSFTALTKRAAREDGLALPLSVYVLAQTLAGLHYAHELTDHDGTPLAVVHRDVSPHNILVTYDGRVKVLDFGIAKAAGSSSETKTGFLKGKVTYMAPEQVGRKALDRRVDVFAVGVMLWEALTGARMWGDLDDFEIFLKLRSDSLPTPSSVRADVPAALEAICMRALAREPADRFATADEMQRALEGWLEEEASRPGGVRVGGRELGARMTELFAEHRAATKAEIDAQIRATPVDGSLVGVPVIRPANVSAINAVTATGLGTTSKTLGGETRVRQARQIRGLRGIAVAALGIAVVASVAAGVATVRGRRARENAGVERSAASGAVTASCARSADCNTAEGGDDPKLCRNRRCVPLRTQRCEVHSEPGDVNDERTIWIGAMFPRDGKDGDSFGRSDLNAVELARRDFVETTRGIPSHTPEALPRPLALVACDDGQDEKATALHLVNDVGIAAVVGFSTSQEAIDLSRDIFVPRGIFVAVANGQSAQVTQVPQPGEGPRLVWRTTPTSALRALPAARLVSELIEPQLRAAHVVHDGAPLRVALVLPKSQYGLSIGEALQKKLVFNHKEALANRDDFAQLTFEFAGGASTSSDLTTIATELTGRAPHVIIYAGRDELVDSVFAPVERAWRAHDYRPYWVSVTNLAGNALFEFLASDAERRKRFLGISSPENTSANALLALRYSAELSKISMNDTPAAAYDAAYVVAYAAYGDDDGLPTGARLASSIARLLPPGDPVEVGATHIFDAFRALSRGASIDLIGADSRLDFDLHTGETAADWVIQCVSADRQRKTVDAVESGLLFDSSSGRLRGDLRCP